MKKTVNAFYREICEKPDDQDFAFSHMFLIAANCDLVC